MSDAPRDVRAIWRELAQRNDWRLVDDEAGFIGEALDELGALTSAGDPEALLRLALLRAYNRRIYQGLAAGHERATAELRETLWRMALKDGCAERHAQDLAQEAVARIFEKLATVRDPGSFMAWARTTLFRLQIRPDKARLETPYPTAEDGSVREIADPADMAAQVVDSVAEQDLRALLRARLPDELDRQVVWRGAVLLERSSDIARDLGIAPDLVRLRKSRALRRLRDDQRFLRTLRSMIDEPAPLAATPRRSLRWRRSE